LYFTEALTVLDKKILEAFMVFDHTSSNTVDVREVGTIIRSLGKLISLFCLKHYRCKVRQKVKASDTPNISVGMVQVGSC
jgi:Ca2+-binding EF-hand superfamily protein